MSEAVQMRNESLDGTCGFHQDDASRTSSPLAEEEESSMMVSSPDGKLDAGVPTARYLPDNRVYAKDEFGGLYEAVIKRASYTGSHWTYLVHYQGWNSRWDRWLKEDDLLPDSEEARRDAGQHANKQRQEQEQQRMLKAAKKEKRKRKKDDMSTSSRSKRRSGAQEGNELLALFEDACELPFTLKTILVEDQERIVRKGFDTLYNGYDHDVEKKWRPARDVHQLPATVTIRTVLNHYVKIKRKDAPAEKSEAAEAKARSFVNDLAGLFDEALPKCLLYPTERGQHLAVEADSTLKDIRKVDLYGCEHLLRLFVRLPDLLAQAPPSDVKATGKQLSDLIVLLQKNRQACFKAKYREPKKAELNDWEKSLRDGTNIVRGS